MITKIMYFGASWCGQCQVVKAHLEKVGVNVEKHDVEKDEATAELYHVQSIPTLLFIDEKEECKETAHGAMTLKQINDIIEKYK